MTTTLEQLASIPREYLIPTDVAPVLGVDAYSISVMVREDKRTGRSSFPFPTIRIGTRTKIPKRPFLAAMGYERSDKND